MASWGLLDDKEENELHKSRLLNVEEKPFKRITKRLNTIYTFAASRARQTATPPPETNGADGQQNQPDSTPAAGDTVSLDLAQLREDVTLDFAAFDSSIARLQFLLAANERERERYAAERERILAASDDVRERTAQLRVQLDQARATLAQRRQFDALADAITANPSLRPRAEQAAALQKLRDEIAELEAEREEYGVTWNERREQFARIMEESMRLRRLIRDEKEEVERREGMDEDADGDAGGGGAGAGGGDGATPRPSHGVASREGTPKPEGGSGLVPPNKGGAEIGEDGTPRDLPAGGATPAGDSPAPGHHESQSSFVAKRAVGLSTSFSQVGSERGSREPSVEVGTAQGSQAGDGEDVEMGEAKAEGSEEPSTAPAEGTPQIVVEGDGEVMDTT
ncbi:hypothetical protein VTJ83DRAFT_523 [Remersonia thermophila]|uniref:Uncharacterized protein n=1 Tax=Remersonia thermophila TaxID=72144 RepID=A0ABR4DLG1_9PEZI